MRISIPCPHCEAELIDTAKAVWFVQGRLYSTQHGTIRHVGCSMCVHRKILVNIFRVLFTGWWSFWGLITTPWVVVQNIAVLVLPSSDRLMKAALNAANIDVEDVTIDGFGQTREQARITNAILDLLSEAVWADGSASKEELFVATTFGVRLVGDSVTIEEIEGRLRIHTRAKIPPSMLNNPDRIVLLRAALTIIAADGVVENRELFFVQGLAERLNVPGELLDRLLESAGFGRNRTRSNTSRSDSLHRAAEILGISSSSSPKEAKNAQRRLALKHHPDRAGPDPTAVKYANAKMAELNWAYEQFASEGSL